MNFLKALNQKNYQTYNRKVAHKLGSVAAAIVLQELIDRYAYHTENRDHDPLIYEGLEWWYETIETMEERTALTRKNQDAAIKILEEAGLILKIQKGCPPKRYFHLHQENIFKLYNDELFEMKKLNIELLICPNGTNQVVPMGQIKLTESDNLKTSQVHLGEKAKYIDYNEPKNEPENNNSNIEKKEISDGSISCKSVAAVSSNLSVSDQSGASPVAAADPLTIYSCLSDLKEITFDHKLRLTRTYLEPHVEHSVKVFKQAINPNIKNPSGLLESFCKQARDTNCREPEIKQTAESLAQTNTEYLNRFTDYQVIGQYRIQKSTKDIEFWKKQSNGLYSQLDATYYVDSPNFIEDIERFMRKHNL